MNIEKNTINGILVYQFPELIKFNNKIKHAITFKNLNFNKKTLSPLLLENNYTLLSNALKINKIITCNQNHTRNILIIKDNNEIKNFSGDYYDALITNTPNIGISVFTADCQPIFLYDFVSNTS